MGGKRRQTAYLLRAIEHERVGSAKENMVEEMYEGVQEVEEGVLDMNKRWPDDPRERGARGTLGDDG